VTNPLDEKRTHNLHILLTDTEDRLLKECLPKPYIPGSQSLVIRALLHRLFKENGLLGKGGEG